MADIDPLQPTRELPLVVPDVVDLAAATLSRTRRQYLTCLGSPNTPCSQPPSRSAGQRASSTSNMRHALRSTKPIPTRGRSERSSSCLGCGATELEVTAADMRDALVVPVPVQEFFTEAEEARDGAGSRPPG